MPKNLLTFAMLLAAVAMTAHAQPPPQTARTFAVVVGVSKYQKLPGGQQLQFADRDASLFSEAIQKRGVSAQNIKLLIGAEATAAAIKSAIGNWLARSVSETDTVLVFFSGHGLFEREFGEAYLLGYDSDPKDPYGTALSVSELGQALAKRVRSGRVLVIADAVRRDFFDPESDPASSKSFEQAFDQLTVARPGLSTIIASGPGEFSREGQRWGGHGVFAKHLTDVLADGAGRNADLALAAEDLFELLKGRVAEDTSSKQHPWRSGRGTGQAEVAHVERSNTPAPPNASVSSKPVEEKKPAAEVRPLPEPRKDVADPKPVAASQPPAEAKPIAKPSGAPVSSAKPNVVETRPAPPPASARAKEPIPVPKKPELVAPPSKDRNDAPPLVARAERPESGVTSKGGETSEVAVASAKEKPAPTGVAPKAATSVNAGPSSTPSKGPSPAPPATVSPRSAQPPTGPPKDFEVRREIPPPNIPPPPKPTISPPSTGSVSSDRAANQPETVTASVPATRPETAPSPLVLQLEAAIASRALIEPRNASAWDLYQRMLSDPGSAADAFRLKPVLAEALLAQGRAIACGDVRGDNISDKVDEFKRAGQMLARARTLAPDNGDISALEKLSAAEALISLQFYDEAERALAPLQTAKLAAVENALGLVYQGRLDSYHAERAFKRASELDAKSAAPHYNLALLYRSQQNQAALVEFEAAAANDQTNANLIVALGDEYFTRQQWKQAADAFRKAIALKPSDDNLHTKLGHALYSQGLQDEANREYEKARELRRKQL